MNGSVNKQQATEKVARRAQLQWMIVPNGQLRRDKREINVDVPHAGLWLDRYLTYQMTKGVSISKEGWSRFQQLVDEAAAIPMPEMYRNFYAQWTDSLDVATVKTGEAKVRGRMVLGMGDESVIETAVTLHHTYGVPYISGSALKGVAAAYARQRLADGRWMAGEQAYQVLFGDTSEAGYIVFHDAYYIPDSAEANKPLAPDILTVHHEKYYQGGNDAPADWDSPKPISFLSVTGSYLVAIQGDLGWVKIAFEILEKALNEYGAGAKTTSGYGRLDLTTLSRKAV
jgi:CRISPR-associated protein Cmr6